MRSFFTSDETKADFLDNNNSQTTENKGVSSENVEITDFEINQNNNNFGSNWNSLINHFNTDKEVGQENPYQQKRQAEKEAEIEAEKEAETEAENNEKGDQHSSEYYQQTGEFIATMENIFIPKGIAYLNGEVGEDKKGIPYANKYKAEKKIVDELGNAWARYLEDKQVKLTPGQQLLWIHIVAYGWPLGMAGINYFKRLQIQKQENQMQLLKTMQSIQNNTTTNTEQYREEQKPVEAEQKSPESIKPNNVEQKRFFVADENKEIKEVQEVEEMPGPIKFENDPVIDDQTYKICKNENCEKSFIEGSGFAKTKGTKNFDQYCSKNCMYNDVNTKNYLHTKRAKKINNG